MRWVRRHPELVILGVFVVVVVVAIVRYQMRASGSAPAAVEGGHGPTAGAPSVAPSQSTSPTVQPTDLPQFDRAGSGTACSMTYGPSQAGGVVTTFTLNGPGELVTHVSGPDGTVRHDEREPAELVFFSYDFTLSQVTDMGAVLYLADGTQQSCTIGPAH